MNEHHAETASNITFKFGLLTTPLSDNITSKFRYFSIKTKKCYMVDKKTHKFPKNGSKNRPSDVIKLCHDTMLDLGYF